MVAKSDPYIGARVQSPDGGTDLVIAAGGALVLETGAKLYSGTSDVTGNLTGGGGSSGLVLISSGTISAPVSFLDVTLPAGYSIFQFIAFGIQFSANDSLVAALSADDGTTFFNDTVHNDSYLQTGFGQARDVPDPRGVVNSNPVMSFSENSHAIGEQPGVSVDFMFTPGSANDLANGFARTVHSWSAFAGIYLQETSQTINPGATVPVTPVRFNLIRFLPYGNGDVNPPTSGETITAGNWSLLGAPS